MWTNLWASDPPRGDRGASKGREPIIRRAMGRVGPQIGPSLQGFQAGWPFKRLCCMQECGSALEDEPTSLCPANSRASLLSGQVSKSNSYLYWTGTQSRANRHV